MPTSTLLYTYLLQQSGGVANYHGNETTTSNVVHQNGIDAGSKVTNSSDAGQSLTRGGSGKNAKQSNGTSQTNKKTKKVPPELSGKRSSNQQTQLPKSDIDSEDEATPISVSGAETLYSYMFRAIS